MHFGILVAYRSTLLATLLTTLVVSLPAHAFNYTSHAAICDAAYQQVSADTRTRIDSLVEQARTVKRSQIKSFAQLCGWPDKIRKQAKYKHTGKWHYLNVSRSATEVTSKDCPADGCVLSALGEMYSRLKKSPDTDWEALAFVGHLVADVHQPMHISYADDRGGNRTKLYFEGDETNLHALWDNKIAGTFLVKHDHHQASNLPSTQMPTNSIDWANESLQQTRKIYKGYRRGMSLSENDILADRQWLQIRIQQAGNRLADALESALTADN